MNRLLFVLATFVLIAVGGCATEPAKPLFVESPSQSLAPPPGDKAQIVFLEPINGIQGLIPVGLFEIDENNSRTLLAVTGARSKVAITFTPGRHRLMANHSGMIAHYLDINVEAGKRYYVLVRFIYGHGFQLRPLVPSGASDYTVLNKDFPSWVSSTRFVEKTREGEEHFERIKDAVTKSQAEGLKTWMGKTPQERAELTLNPQDSVPR